MLTNELLDAVDALTLPYTTKILQSNDAGIHCVSTITHTPRLAHLRAAIVGGIGSHGGSSNEPRLPFDAGALALYDEIEAEVGRWFVAATASAVFPSPEQTLRRWYLAFHDADQKGQVTDESRWEHTGRLQAWARQIDAKFDPPHVLELLAACPECGERFALDPKTGDQVTALVVEYRQEGALTVEHAVVSCRFCERRWVGGAGSREVAWEIENADGEGGRSDD